MLLSWNGVRLNFKQLLWFLLLSKLNVYCELFYRELISFNNLQLSWKFWNEIVKFNLTCDLI